MCAQTSLAPYFINVFEFIFTPLTVTLTQEFREASLSIYSMQNTVLTGAGPAKWPHPGSLALDVLPGNLRRMPLAAADSAGQQGPLAPLAFPGTLRRKKRESQRAGLKLEGSIILLVVLEHQPFGRNGR